MNKVAVIATHPDDETLGCGGTLLKHKFNNDEIHWIENLLNDNKIKEQGVLNSVLVKNQLDKFRYGNQNNQYLLWDIIIFQQWYDFNENNID